MFKKSSAPTINVVDQIMSRREQLVVTAGSALASAHANSTLNSKFYQQEAMLSPRQRVKMAEKMFNKQKINTILSPSTQQMKLFKHED